MSKKIILYITELFPYPPTSGAKIKSLNTIQTLSKKFNIILVCFNQSPVKQIHLSKINKFTLYTKVFTLPDLNTPPQDKLLYLVKNYIKLKPYFLYQFYSRIANKYIQQIIKNIKLDVIHIDHINMAQYLPFDKQQKWVLEEHNIEHYLAFSKFKNYTLMNKTKIHLLCEYLLIRLFEWISIRKFDHVLTISRKDELIIKNKFSAQSTSSFAPVVNTKKNSEKLNNSSTNLLFIGDMTWQPNIEAVQWFSKKILPLIIKNNKKIKFHLVGEISHELKNKLDNKNTKIYGYQKDISKFLRENMVFVLPFKSGSGVKIKALTALSNGIPIVSTKVGISGLDYLTQDEYLYATTAKEFASQSINLMSDKQLRMNLSKNGITYTNKFHSKENNKELLNTYNKITQ